MRMSEAEAGQTHITHFYETLREGSIFATVNT